LEEAEPPFNKRSVLKPHYSGTYYNSCVNGILIFGIFSLSDSLHSEIKLFVTSTNYMLFLNLPTPPPSCMKIKYSQEYEDVLFFVGILKSPNELYDY
jgi:hypothetical protein